MVYTRFVRAHSHIDQLHIHYTSCYQSNLDIDQLHTIHMNPLTNHHSIYLLFNIHPIDHTCTLYMHVHIGSCINQWVYQLDIRDILFSLSSQYMNLFIIHISQWFNTIMHQWSIIIRYQVDMMSMMLHLYMVEHNQLDNRYLFRVFITYTIHKYP